MQEAQDTGHASELPDPRGTPSRTDTVRHTTTASAGNTKANRGQRESAMLILRHGSQTGRYWPLSRTASLVIGRHEKCDIILPDRQVSRNHARIFWDSYGYSIEDLGSKNGTHVNGIDVIKPHSLDDGDEVQIALRFKLAFVDDGATTPLTFNAVEAADGLRIDEDARQVWLNGTLLEPPLSLHQYRLLNALWHADGSIVTREQIVQAVWPEASGEGVSEQAIDALMRRLRKRLNDYDDVCRYIVTVRGHGFRLENR